MKINRKFLKYSAVAFFAMLFFWFFLVKTDSLLSNWVFSATRPLVKAGNSVYLVANSFFETGKIRAENTRLYKENLELLSENIKLKEQELENIALRKQLNLAILKDKKTIRADISGFDPISFNNFFVINKGIAEGIEKDLPVLSSEGVLIGRIEESFDQFSRVTVIFSPNSSVAIVSLDSRSKGILKGDFGTSLIMDMIPQYEELLEGEVVATSGMGQLFPKGVPIGTVDKIVSSNNDIFKKASVDAFADLNKMETVIVILN